jgi:hypothetical protein
VRFSPPVAKASLSCLEEEFKLRGLRREEDADMLGRGAVPLAWASVSMHVIGKETNQHFRTECVAHFYFIEAGIQHLQNCTQIQHKSVRTQQCTRLCRHTHACTNVHVTSRARLITHIHTRTHTHAYTHAHTYMAQAHK